MKPYQVIENKEFIGRKVELERISEIEHLANPVIIVVYGRRRIGKTELIEYAFSKRNLLKFEGLEGKTELEQISLVLHQLARYAEDPKISKLNLTKWIEVFELIAQYVSQGKWTLYFE